VDMRVPYLDRAIHPQVAAVNGVSQTSCVIGPNEGPLFRFKGKELCVV
jgi:hypothetical protein